MSAQEIITLMSKLSTLHERLLEISQQKTLLLKDGDFDSLQKTLLSERKYLLAIGQLEEKRVAVVENWFKQKGDHFAELTVSNMLKNLDKQDEKKELEEIYEKLIITIANLKLQEQLNYDLTQQSLQFVELSLDLLQPSLTKLNYGKNDQVDQNSQRSIFDSKA
jgi:hypothetical protein